MSMRVAGAAILLSTAGAAQAAADDSALVARGEYLARAADCMPCHTGDRSRPYAGGLALNTPFGALYSANITSHPQAGIGRWTFDDFRNALHNGIRKDGAYLYPGMPFDAYTLIQEDDLKALWAHIRRLPPSDTLNKKNGLSFPFNVRTGLLAWRELFFRPGYFTPNPAKDGAWNRGAYLVEALGHCSDCHSPRNIMGAVKGKELLTGSQIDGFYAPDISAAALARAWTRNSLVQFFKTGGATRKTTAFGPMSEVVHDSLATLADDDLQAMAAYLFDSPPPASRPKPQQASPMTADAHVRASALYVDNCAGCHQPHGTGIDGSIPPLTGNPAVTAAEPGNVIMAILQGLPAAGAYDAMPSFAGRLSDGQIADLSNYIRTSWGNQGSPNATAAMVGAWRAAANVPVYGTEAAQAMGCPQVGGGPSAGGPDPAATASLSAVLQGRSVSMPDLVQTYRNAVPGASADEVVNAIVAAYCPILARRGGPAYAMSAELRSYGVQAAYAASRPAETSSSAPTYDVIWAVPAGRTLVAREPTGAATLTCPNADSSLVPAALAQKGAALIGKPALPVGGDAASRLAGTLADQNSGARPADVANALIGGYCTIVAADASTPPALGRSWIQSFGEQVIQTLQLRTAKTAAAP